MNVLLDRGNGKAFPSAAGIRSSFGFCSIQVDTIVQHRTSVFNRNACMCSKTSRVDNTKSVHNRFKPAVVVRTAQGLSSNQNEAAINS